ncbi:MAG: gas vesicle protein K [Deltaproteobacteria bacterium]
MRRAAKSAPPVRVGGLIATELSALREAISREASKGTARWNADPEDVQRSVVRLVLTLVEFLRRLLERQAIRRVEAGSFSPAEEEAVGSALMQLETVVRDIAARFGIPPEELNLDLGPLGKLL